MRFPHTSELWPQPTGALQGCLYFHKIPLVPAGWGPLANKAPVPVTPEGSAHGMEGLRCPQPPVLLGALHRASKRGKDPRAQAGKVTWSWSGSISGIKSEITDESIEIHIFSWHFNGDSCEEERVHPILHSQPPALQDYLWTSYISCIFSLPFSLLSLPFLACFCKLNYLNALFGSLKSQRFPLFPPWLPFLSLLSAPAFSGSFPVLFQWHLLKFAQKKILLQCHNFSPGRRFMGAGRHPWRGGFAGRKKGRRERKCDGKEKDAQSWGERRIDGGEGSR